MDEIWSGDLEQGPAWARDAPALLYLVRPGEQNEELRFSLRSLANLAHGEVFVVGHCPRWVRNVTYLPGNAWRDPRCNVYRNIAAACAHPQLPDQFLIMNDDFFVMEPWTYRTEYRGTLAEHLAILSHRNGTSWWGNSLRATGRWLNLQGITEPLSYELHKPFAVEKAKMAQVLAECELDRFEGEQWAQWRTLYGNYFDIGGTPSPDCKVCTLAGRVWMDWELISTNDSSFKRQQVGEHIRARFEQPSPYEWPGLAETARKPARRLPVPG